MHTHRIYLRSRPHRHGVYAKLNARSTTYYVLAYHHQVAVMRRSYRAIRQLQRAAGEPTSRQHNAQAARFLLTDVLQCRATFGDATVDALEAGIHKGVLL